MSIAHAAQVPDLLQRDFTASEPNIKYVGDITYLPVGDGQFLYLATVLDLCSKRLVGWATADHMRTELVTDALVAAARTRGDLAGAGWLGLGRQDEDEAVDLVGGEAQGRDGAGGVRMMGRYEPWPGSRMHAPAALRLPVHFFGRYRPADQWPLSLVTLTAAPRFGAALLASSSAWSRSAFCATTMLTADPDTASRRTPAPATGY